MDCNVPASSIEYSTHVLGNRLLYVPIGILLYLVSTCWLKMHMHGSTLTNGFDGYSVS